MISFQCFLFFFSSAKRRTLHLVPSTSTPKLLITQVTKNVQNGTNQNGTNVSVNDSYSADNYDDINEYVPMVSVPFQLIRIRKFLLGFKRFFSALLV